MNFLRRKAIYADCSVYTDVATAAWYVSRTSFGVTRLEFCDSDTAEPAAVLAALSHSKGRVTVHTDCEPLTIALHADPSSEIWRRAVTKNPSLNAIRTTLARRRSTIVFCSSHRATTPDPMRFCDGLARALSRRAHRLDLAIGKELSAPTTLPACPAKKPILFHLDDHVISLLGPRTTPHKRVRLDKRTRLAAKSLAAS